MFFTFSNAVIKRMSKSITHDQFTINLSSNPSLNVYKSNTLASFRTILSSPLELEGSWDVGVTELTYPRQIYSIRDSCFDFFYHGKNLWVKECGIEKGIYHSVDNLLEEMIRAIHRKRGVWNKEKLHRYISWKVDEQGKLELNNGSTTKFANVSPGLFHNLGSQQEPSHSNFRRQSTILRGIFLLIFTTGTKCTFTETSLSSVSLGTAELRCWTAFLSSNHNTCHPRK